MPFDGNINPFTPPIPESSPNHPSNAAPQHPNAGGEATENAVPNAIEQKVQQEKTIDGQYVSPTDEAIGRWVYRNRGLVSGNPIGYTTYQFLRSTAATIPYGIIAGAVFKGTEALKNWAEPGAKAAEGKYFSKALHAVTNRGGALGALSAAAQIGASFTLYRTVSFAGRNFYDRVYDNRNTEEETIKQVARAPANFVKDFTLNFNTQKVAVPWAALTLGSILTMMDKPKYETLKAAEHNWFKMISHNKGFSWQNAAVATVAYGTFFEVANLLGNVYRKDKGLTLAVTPEKPHPGLERSSEDKRYGFFTNEGSLGRLAFRHMIPVAVGVGSYVLAKKLGYRASVGKKGKEFYKNADEIMAAARRSTVGKSEKVADEIIADAKVKAAGQMGKAWNLDSSQDMLTNMWREGAATSLFMLYPLAKDPWEDVYDNFFERLEVRAEKYNGKINGTTHKSEDGPEKGTQYHVAAANNNRIIANHQKLHEALYAKEQQQGIAV